jgi:hypothetical protein
MVVALKRTEINGHDHQVVEWIIDGGVIYRWDELAAGWFDYESHMPIPNSTLSRAFALSKKMPLKGVVS